MENGERTLNYDIRFRRAVIFVGLSRHEKRKSSVAPRCPFLSYKKNANQTTLPIQKLILTRGTAWRMSGGCKSPTRVIKAARRMNWMRKDEDRCCGSTDSTGNFYATIFRSSPYAVEFLYTRPRVRECVLISLKDSFLSVLSWRSAPQRFASVAQWNLSLLHGRGWRRQQYTEHCGRRKLAESAAEERKPWRWLATGEKKLSVLHSRRNYLAFRLCGSRFMRRMQMRYNEGENGLCQKVDVNLKASLNGRFVGLL